MTGVARVTGVTRVMRMTRVTKVTRVTGVTIIRDKSSAFNKHLIHISFFHSFLKAINPLTPQISVV